ncbi:MAG TPA: hypothetical protein VFK87_01685 [Steroidobacteraceae bacterium]|nr:hypothetical protein [Steroidobacteraceae bacterium]
MLTAVALLLCSAGDEPPQAPAEGITPEEVHAAPPGMLTLRELAEEDLRLAELPNLAHPVVAVTAGGALCLGGAAVTTGIVWSASRPSPASQPGARDLSWLFGAIMAGVFGGTGCVMGIIGASFLPYTLGMRRLYAERRAAVHARMEAMHAFTAAPPAPHSLEELRALESERPGYLLPASLIAGGTVPLILGVATYAGLRPGSSLEALAVSIGLTVVGLAAEGLGVGLLLRAIRTRMELDEKIRALDPPLEEDTPPPQPAPAGSALPPLPLQLGFGGSF